LTELLKVVVSGDLDQTRAKDVLAKMIETGASVSEASDKLGIVKVDSSEIDSLCQQLIDENEKVVNQIKEGNEKAVGALIYISLSNCSYLRQKVVCAEYHALASVATTLTNAPFHEFNQSANPRTKRCPRQQTTDSRLGVDGRGLAIGRCDAKTRKDSTA